MKNPNPFNDLGRLAELAKTRPVWLRVGRLIDGVADAAARDVDVVFDGLQIRSVGTTAEIEGISTPDAVLSDCTLLPCLIEAHAHMFLDGAPIDAEVRRQYLSNSPAWMLERARSRWTKILQCGIGAVRDAGDKHGVGLALSAERKNQIDKPAATPWIDSPGAAIHHRGRYGSFMAEPIENFASADECVAARVAAGADRIKLLATGIINFEAGQVTTPPQMEASEIATLVRAAMSRGRQAFAHASGTEGIGHCIEGGVTTVEHGFFINTDQLLRMCEKGIGWVPTLAPVQLQIDRAAELGWGQKVVGHLKRIIESHQEMLQRASRMGVMLIAGSDAGSCGVPHGIGLLSEMRQMEDAGVPAMAVLRSATSVSADVLQFAEPIGRIAPGFRARFIVTRHDPLKTIANLRKEKTILFDGRALHCDGETDDTGL